MRPLAIVTCDQFPELHVDERPLIPALAKAGLEAVPVVWSHPSVDWSRFEAVILRNTWDYHLRRDEFLAWVERASAQTRVWNPPEVIRWNSHKGYLRDLARAGIRIAPTEWIERGASTDLASLVARRGWSEIVVKPAVSAGAMGTRRFDRAAISEARAHAEALAEETDVMVQPYLRELGEKGERSLYFFNGEFSYAIRRPAGMKGEPASEAAPHAFDPSEQELELARQVIAQAPAELL